MKSVRGREVLCHNFLAVALLLLAAGAAHAAGTWSAAASLATGRTTQSATLLQNGKVLVAGGQGNGSSYPTGCELYDPGTNTWSVAGSLATAREDHTATLLPSGKVLVAGGYSGSAYLASAELYDPGTNSWSAAGTLATARYGHTATLLPSGKVLVAGGNNGSSFLASAEIYDPGANTWSAAGSLATARYCHTATLLPNGKVLVAGGWNTNSSLTSAELYDPGTNTWSTGGTLTIARSAHTATLLPTVKVLLTGGNNGSSFLASAEIYDPALNTWSLAGSLAAARCNHTATVLPSGKVVVAAGENIGGELTSAEIYDSGTNTWSTTAGLATARDCHTATLLPSGRVLVAGGWSGSADLASAEIFDYTAGAGSWSATGNMTTTHKGPRVIALPNGKVLVGGNTTTTDLYDPATGTFTATGSTKNYHQDQALVLLPNGKVLVVGGCTGSGTAIASCEVYDPSTGNWVNTGSLATARCAWDNAVVLPNGKVLAAGGYTGNGTPLATTEIYDPATGVWTSGANMSVPRMQTAALLLQNGKVLVAGGSDGSKNLASAELYDPATGTWTTTGSMGAARRCAAARLQNGKVLVLDGFDYTGACELYDPANGTWSITGSLNDVRSFFHVVLLPNGKVLVAGGNGTGGVLATAELYDPVAGTWSRAGSMTVPRQQPGLAALPNGKALAVGGNSSSNTPLASADIFDPGLGFQDSWRPVISTVPLSLNLGMKLSVGGSLFKGISEASGGGYQSSATNYPLVQLHSLVNDQWAFLMSDPNSNWSDTAFTSAPVNSFPQGYAEVTVFTNGIPSLSKTIAIGAATLVVADFPSPTTAGTPGNVTVSAASGYTGTVHFSSSDPTAVLPADYTFVTGDNGSHTFSVTLKAAGTQSITATDTGNSTLTGTQSGIVVNPAAASTLVVAGFPSPTTAGTAGNVTVTAKDVYGNTATGYRGTVHFTSSDGQAVLPGDYTFVAADNGSHAVSATLKTAGTQWTKATDTNTGSINGTQSNITVNPASASTLIVAGFPSPVTAGTAANVTVTARDPYGNTATGYTGTIHFTSSDGAAVLPADYTFVSGDSGVKTLPATLKIAGTQTLTATDTVTSSIYGTQTSITVTPGPFAKLQLLVPGETAAPGTASGKTGTPYAQAAGTAFNVVVNAVDANWNVVTTIADTVGLTSTDTNATKPANTPLVNGTITLSITLNTAGNWTISASDITNGGITQNTSPSITVNPGATFTKLQILVPGETAAPGAASGKTGTPSAQTAGVAFSVIINAVDGDWNVINSVTDTVGITSTDAYATRPGNTALVNGTKTLSVTLNAAGSWTITASDITDNTKTPNTSPAITVNPGPFAKLQILVPGETAAPGSATGKTGTPDAQTAGTGFNVKVNAVDNYWNVINTVTHTVGITASDANALRPANAALSSGTGTFGVTLKTAGNWTVTASDVTDGTKTPSTSPAITVNPGAFTKMQILVPGETAAPGTANGKTGTPDAQTAGTAFDVRVKAVDDNWNVISTVTDYVAITSSDTNAGLPANAPLSNGTGTFSGVILKKAGSATVTANDIPGDITKVAKTPDTSPAITVNPGPFTKLQILVPGETVAPGTSSGKTGRPDVQTAGAAFSVTVNAVDDNWNVVNAATDTVVITSSDTNAERPANAPLSDGTGTFIVKLKTAGSATVTATDAGNGQITDTSPPIPVNPAPVSAFAFSGIPSQLTAGQAVDFTLTAVDAFGNRTGYTGTVHFTSSDPKAQTHSDYLFQQDELGRHSFSNGVTLKTAGTQSITATDINTPSITKTQGNITVIPAPASNLAVTSFPSPTKAGGAGNVTVTAKDPYGNTATGYTGTIHFTSSDSAATLPSDYKFVSGDGGTKTFSATLQTVDTQSITVTDTATANLTGAQTGITVNPQPPVITSALTAGGELGLPFSYQITATNSPTTYDAQNRPSWVSINTNTGTITGTPQALADAVTSAVTITATNVSGTDSKVLQITIYQGPPRVNNLLVSRNPVRTETDVTFTADAYAPSGLPLTYTWYYYDPNGNQAFPAQTGQAPSTTQPFATQSTYVVQVRASDGYRDDTDSRNVNVIALAPQSDTPSILSPNGTTVTNPSNGLSITVGDSLGGVVDLNVGYNGASGSARDQASFLTLVQQMPDFHANNSTGFPGAKLASKFTKDLANQGHRIFVVETTDQQDTTKKVRLMVPVSDWETGQKTVSAPAINRGIAFSQLKGKFNFSAAKRDSVTLQCSIVLPPGTTFSSNLPISVGVGNVIGSGSVDSKGKVTILAGGDFLKKVQVKWPSLKKNNPVTKLGDKAKVSITMSLPNMQARGFDTEGIVNTNLPAGKARHIQVAIVLDGVSYYTQAAATYVFKPNTKGGGTGQLMIQK